MDGAITCICPLGNSLNTKVGKYTVHGRPSAWTDPEILDPTRHKIGHFGDVSPSQPLGLVSKARFSYLYASQPGNEAGLFSKDKINRGGDK